MGWRDRAQQRQGRNAPRTEQMTLPLSARSSSSSSSKARHKLQLGWGTSARGEAGSTGKVPRQGVLVPGKYAAIVSGRDSPDFQARRVLCQQWHTWAQIGACPDGP